MIPIDRSLRIRLLEALKQGYINPLHFPEIRDVQPKFDLSRLTEDERAVLLKIGELTLNDHDNTNHKEN